ncbi:phage tail assembly chaperone family protein, TAC [Moraxella sp. ZJ142]|uniref:phage tail assembly chaperone family protein, TAC n=1 Tax=Moraxella marmotae TaxID=3344520 RepID=UPI0035D50918
MSKRSNVLIEAFLNKSQLSKSTLSSVAQEFYLKKLTIGDQASLYATKDDDNPFSQMMTMIWLSVCDADGNRVFEDVEAVKALDSQIATELIDKINKLNSFDKDSEDLEKN